ncbi:hypothetical protein OIE66_12910 [Nonomuraea sp. NBC_01738]|uniref:hypothetical protein n=1 Tax=Nonomuraea sp. NBC_01738 TaxID=2976003 RepID=UPI002E1399CB|nr:hypothetical protein OIE66_12910 [Nonomuraea sp. NBC_01738]
MRPAGGARDRPRWRALLEAHPADWHARYHLGLVRYADGDLVGAQAAWQESLARERTPWTLRCLAESARLAGEPHADLLLAAHALAPQLTELTVETLRALLDAGRPAEALAIIDALGETGGRVRLLEARAALAAGDLDRTGTVLDGDIEVDNLREGEDSLDAVWFAYHERRLADGSPITEELAARARRENPLPARYDFRMHD